LVTEAFLGARSEVLIGRPALEATDLRWIAPGNRSSPIRPSDSAVDPHPLNQIGKTQSTLTASASADRKERTEIGGLGVDIAKNSVA